jgi:hypothetical protein
MFCVIRKGHATVAEPTTNRGCGKRFCIFSLRIASSSLFDCWPAWSIRGTAAHPGDGDAPGGAKLASHRQTLHNANVKQFKRKRNHAYQHCWA